MRPGVVDETLLAASMDLAHREPAPFAPAAVELAELGIAIALGVLLEVQQLQGDAGVPVKNSIFWSCLNLSAPLRR